MATYYVATNGNDSNNGTFTATPWASFSKFTSIANPGDTLVIRGGTYYQSINIGRSGNSGAHITITNYPGEIVKLDGQNTRPGSDWIGLIQLQANYIDCVGTAWGSIKVYRSSGRGLCIYGNNCLIKYCYAEECKHSGLYVDFGTGNTLDSCECFDCAHDNNGTVIGYSKSGDGGTVPGYNITTNPNGLTWSGGINIGNLTAGGTVVVDQTVIKNCISRQNRGEGISTLGGTNSTIQDCTSYNNYSVNIYVDTSVNAIVQRNLSYNDGGSVLRNGNVAELIAVTDESTAKPATTGFKIINNLGNNGYFRVLTYWNTTTITNATIAHNTIVGNKGTGFGATGSGTIITNNVFNASVVGGSPSLPASYVLLSPTQVTRLANVLTDYYNNARGNPTTTGAIDSAPAPAYGPLPSPWVDTDIGTVGTPGSAGYQTGTYQILGSGTDVSGTTDSFNAIYQPSSKDWSLIAHVSSIQNTAAYAKFGLMLRDSLAANAACVAIAINPNSRLESIIRTTAGGTAANGQVITTTALWLRLQKVGNIITPQYCPDAAPSTLNLATSGTASASSTESVSYPASNAIDGSLTTRWSSAATNTEWLQVDLGSAQTIVRVSILWETAYATSYQILTSTDATNWTTVYSTTSGTGGLVNLMVTPSTGRYVRVNCLNRATVYGYSIFDLSVFGRSNIALNKTAAASSTESASYPASYAFDGNATTRWSSAFSDPQWLSVDLGSSFSVSQVTLIWEAAYAAAYQIQVSSDNTAWTTVYSTTTGTGGTVNITFTAASCRYVRMYATGRGTAWGYSLYEMQVYGDPVWTTLGTPTTLTLPTTTYPMVFVCSQISTAATGLFDSVSFTDADPVAPPPTGTWIFGIAV